MQGASTWDKGGSNSGKSVKYRGIHKRRSIYLRQPVSHYQRRELAWIRLHHEPRRVVHSFCVPEDRKKKEKQNSTKMIRKKHVLMEV